MNQKIQYFIRLAILLVGLLIHTFFFHQFYACLIGYLAILLSTVCIDNGKSNERIFADPSEPGGEWRPIPEDKLSELLSYITPMTSTGRGSSSSLKGSMIATTIVCGVVSVFAWAFLQELISLPAVFYFDIPIVIYSFYRFYYKATAPHPLSIQVMALHYFQTLYIPESFTRGFEARIVKDKNGDPDILDVRLQIRPKTNIKDLLCMMGTISRTKVQETIYPYAYFVIVFKGNQFVTKKISNVYSELNNIVNNSSFRCEFNVQDGNSVCVILPRSKSTYTTDMAMCQELSEIITNACDLINRNRNHLTA